MRVREMARDSNGKLPAFTFPGSYPIVYLTRDNQVICADCASDDDTSDDAEYADVYYEGPDLACDDCGTKIESAYGDPDSGEATD